MATKKINDEISKTVTQVSTSGPTTGQYATYQYGAMPTYTPKYQGGIDENLNKIENYGSYQSRYQPQIDQALSRVTDTTPYASRYQDQIDRYVNLMNQDYDPNSDASYLAYKNQYLRGGQKAMQDTMAKAVALSGGYDNSYANSVAQQQYGEYTAALADKIPELAKAAQDMYMNRLGMYQTLDNTDYSRWADDRANNYNILSALQGVDNTAYGRWQDERANLYDLLGAYQNMENMNYNRFNDEVSRFNTAYSQQKALEDAALAAASGGGGGGGRSGGSGRGRSSGSSSGSTDLMTELRYANSIDADPYDMWAYAQDQTKNAKDLAKQTGRDPGGLINAIRKAQTRRK